jgi:glycine dehydrogenase subunit 1
MFKYLPHTAKDVEEMLQKIGVTDIDDLFSVIDPKVRYQKELNIPRSHSEYELHKEAKRLASKNQPLVRFVGAGSYDTYGLSVVDAITSRQEFLTSYTPYQPEVSQGTLQYIFEFQSMIAELTGMDVSNASMYDGATSAAEAMFMAYGQTRKSTFLISKTVDPKIRDVVQTYAKYRGLKVELIEHEGYETSVEDLKSKLHSDVSGILIQQPNYYGVIEQYDTVAELIHGQGAIVVMSADPSTLSVLKTPREQQVDIACGEAQSLGLPVAFGGPYVGYLATTQKLLRKMPGRICGLTKDVDGRRGFVLTLQAREQHIRRDKANSNICSNQSLMALAVVIYMSLMGKQGLIDVAERAYNNAHYLHEKLMETHQFEQCNQGEFFKEFVLKYKGDPKALQAHWLENGYMGGLLLEDDSILFCATEVRTQEEIDQFVGMVGEENV